MDLSAYRLRGRPCGHMLPHMSQSVESITEAVLALPSDARALLADRLVESLDPLADDAVRGAWIAESVQRLEDVRSGRVRTVPGHEALARARSKAE